MQIFWVSKQVLYPVIIRGITRDLMKTITVKCEFSWLRLGTFECIRT